MSLKIDIKKGNYNKTVCKDGIHHEVDTSKDYTYYEVNLFKRYYDIESKEELKKQIKKDLTELIKALDDKEMER